MGGCEEGDAMFLKLLYKAGLVYGPALARAVVSKAKKRFCPRVSQWPAQRVADALCGRGGGRSRQRAARRDHSSE